MLNGTLSRSAADPLSLQNHCCFMMNAVQGRWTRGVDLLVSKNPGPGLRLAYGMLLVQMLWGFDRIPDNFKLESVIASTGYTVGRVLRMCPIPQVRFDCVLGWHTVAAWHVDVRRGVST